MPSPRESREREGVRAFLEDSDAACLVAADVRSAKKAHHNWIELSIQSTSLIP